MWVYHLGKPEDSQRFACEVEIAHGDIALRFAGPVHSLTASRAKASKTEKTRPFRNASRLHAGRAVRLLP